MNWVILQKEIKEVKKIKRPWNKINAGLIETLKCSKYLSKYLLNYNWPHQLTNNNA